MTNLYLIAHKVRGEPAFDIAQRICEGDEMCQGNCGSYPECKQEDIWIIPTSGHRAFPYWYAPLDGLGQYSDIGFFPAGICAMPPDLRDHYTAEREVARSLIDTLGLIHRPLAPIKRRF